MIWGSLCTFIISWLDGTYYILKDKTMHENFMYTPNYIKLNNPFCGCKLFFVRNIENNPFWLHDFYNQVNMQCIEICPHFDTQNYPFCRLQLAKLAYQ